MLRAYNDEAFALSLPERIKTVAIVEGSISTETNQPEGVVADPCVVDAEEEQRDEAVPRANVDDSEPPVLPPSSDFVPPPGQTTIINQTACHSTSVVGQYIQQQTNIWPGGQQQFQHYSAPPTRDSAFSLAQDCRSPPCLLLPPYRATYVVGGGGGPSFTPAAVNPGQQAINAQIMMAALHGFGLHGFYQA